MTIVTQGIKDGPTMTMTTTIKASELSAHPALPEYVTPEYLKDLKLRQGAGNGEPGQRCAIQEVRFWLHLDAHVDTIPECVSEVIGQLVIGINDSREEWRQELVPLLPRLVGSRGSEALELRRMYRLLDWSAREALPAGVDVLAAAVEPHDAKLAGELRAGAAALKGLSPIVDEATRAAAVGPLRARALALALALARARALALALARARAVPSSPCRVRSSC